MLDRSTGGSLSWQMHGGAQSDTKPKPPRTENKVQGVGMDNAYGEIFHAAANLRFKQELNKYTGDKMQ